MIKDFEKLAMKYDHRIKFILLVWSKNKVSSGLKHNLGIFNKKNLPSLRIIKFGEYVHLRHRKAKRIKDKERKERLKKLGKVKKESRKEQMKRARKLFSSDTPHPAHNNASRVTTKYLSNDVSKEGIKKFLNDFFENKISHYYKSDHLPADNDKRHVKTINSYTYKEFLEKAKEDNKIAVIWVYPHSSHEYTKFYGHFAHLAKQPAIKKHFVFANIDMSKNEKPSCFGGRNSYKKMYLYRNETDPSKHWHVTEADDLARLFKYFMAKSFEKNIQTEEMEDL